ncbi:MAG: S8 family serine peptidase [Candidatus Zixiibacteriota bacterium]
MKYNRRFDFLLFFIVILILTSGALAQKSVLNSEPIFTDKEIDNKIEVVKTYLTPRAENNIVKIWVFFTDKNISTKDEFDKLAASVTLTDNARNRRAKVGLDKITFGDLQVSSDYIGRVESLGGKLRKSSRWLNAASFEISLDLVDAINNLPFVSKVRPVLEYIREPVKIDLEHKDPIIPNGLQSSYYLDYGQSLDQLVQINVPAVHEKGYNGQGVIVAMFDTGFRKDHEAFADAFNTGRVLAEWDFVFNDGNTQNEVNDAQNQHNHGTYTWSTLGGAKEGILYGPAYGASFILAKTEDVRSETQVEEDNWVAAVEWADSIGADVISSSLAYIDWYVYADVDGETAVTTIAANLATSYGIVVANSMGNEGPGPGSVLPPSDAFEILAVGAVDSHGYIAGFSSRGPTYDGRIKPEVCARGVATFCASPSGTTAYTTANGTSLSCPLAGGSAAVLLSARPGFTPQLIRRALIETASQSNTPDNDYGYGIIDLGSAIEWGAKIVADKTTEQVPFDVNFFDMSDLQATQWNWDFGDGATSNIQNPSHSYNVPGIYDVTLTITTEWGDIADIENNFIIALADTMVYATDSVYAGQIGIISVDLTNSLDLWSMRVPIDISKTITNLTIDSISVSGTRTDGFSVTKTAATSDGKKKAYRIYSTTESIPPGTGTIAKIYIGTDSLSIGGRSNIIDTVTLGQFGPEMNSGEVSFTPIINSGAIYIYDVMRGDANNDSHLNVGDAVYLINHVFKGGTPPITIESGDANFDIAVDVADAVYLINHILKNGPPPFDFK